MPVSASWPAHLPIWTQAYRDVLAVNLDGVFFTLRAAAKHMIARAENGDPGGSLVGIASLAAIEGAARNQHYAATKGAVVSMMKSIAVEHARYVCAPMRFCRAGLPRI